MDLKEKLVLPGDKIGVIEEFSGSGDVIVNHGIIYSTKVGRVIYDMSKRVAIVKGLEPKSKIPNIGDIITGVAETVQSNFIVVKLVTVNGEVVHNDFSLLLYLSSGSGRIRTPCRVGDMVKAKVKSVKNGAIFLSINEPQLGVISTTCSHCGGEVIRIKPNLIKCTVCGQVDYRKLSSEFKRGRKKNIGELKRRSSR